MVDKQVTLLALIACLKANVHILQPWNSSEAAALESGLAICSESY